MLGFNKNVILIYDLDGKARWEIYIKEIKEALDNNKSVIILFPDVDSVIKAKEIIKGRLECSLGVLYRKQPQELEEWIRVKKGKTNVVIGTRSGIFAPVNNLGLVIIDEEQDAAYKQEQVPHYNAREVAFMRVNLAEANLILGSSSPSLESLYKALTNKIKYIFIPRDRNYPEVKIMDMRNLPITKKGRVIFSKYLEDSIVSSLNSKGKVLLFLNRKGFATFSSCRYCGMVLKCPRCNINLVYHFKDSILSCHYCNFKMQLPTICPNCNSGYIRYSGMGTEKIESELSRMFPQARIKRLDDPKDIDIKDADIFIATKSIIRMADYPECSLSGSVSSGSRSYTSQSSGLRDNFDLIGVLAIDNSLNRIDFRSGEKTFGMLVRLLRLTEGKIVIQTNLPNHYVFEAILNKDTNIFYEEELKQRKHLKLPPFKHLGLVKLRGKNEARVKEASNALFNRLNRYKKRGINIVSVNPGHPSKLRDNFYWQILIKSNNAQKISKFLKTHLKNFSHSGIIVTVDVDPV